MPRICAALIPLSALLFAFTPATASAAEIGPTKSRSSGVSFLDVGRGILIVLAFAAILGALVVKIRAARALRKHARDQSSAS